MVDTFLVEQNILSILLKKPKMIHKVSAQIELSYFTNEPQRKQNKAIYMVLDYISKQKDMEDLKFDSMTILSIMQKFDNLSKSIKSIFDSKEDFINYIETLRDSPIDPSNLDIHLKQLKKINIVNGVNGTLRNYLDNLEGNYEQWSEEGIIDRLETRILDVSSEYNTSENKAYISGNKDRVQKYRDKKPNENGFVGLPFPLDKVNKFSRGLLRKGSTTVVNANSGVGKSIILMSVAKFLAIDNGIPVYMGANEQKIDEQEERMIKQMTGLPSLIIENYLYNSDKEYITVKGKQYKTKECREKVLDAIQTIEDAPIYFDKISGYTAGSLVHRARYFKKRHNIQCFIWDYVKESTATNLADGQLRHWLANIVRTLKEDIADKLDIAVLTASQAKTYEYWLSAESYGIEKFCTAFCLLRELEQKEQKPLGGKYAFTVKKNRYGKEHPDYKKNWISLDLNEQHLKFEEMT